MSGEWHFGGWAVRVGDQVALDDTIAMLTSRDGRERPVQASKGGTVLQIRDGLRRGDLVDSPVEDLLMIGKFSEPEIGFMERAVKVPSTDVVFQYFLVNEGDWVGTGDAIAQVMLLTDSWPREELLRIHAPSSGSIVWTMPLRPGRINEQTASVAIAKVRVGALWWPVLLFALLTSCYLLFQLRKVMSKASPKDAAPRYKCIVSDQPVQGEPQPRCCSRVMPHEVEDTHDDPPAPEPGLRLDFDDEGTTRTIYALYRPLGIRHRRRIPITVDAFTANSYARSLGVQLGWTLQRVEGEELGADFQDDSARLDFHMRELPVWPLPLEFEREGGQLPSVVHHFNVWPIGLEFKNEMPITVDAVQPGGTAERVGVQKGWVIIRIGDYEVRPDASFEGALKAFKQAVRGLEPYGGALDTLSV